MRERGPWLSLPGADLSRPPGGADVRSRFQAGPWIGITSNQRAEVCRQQQANSRLPREGTCTPPPRADARL